MENENIGCKDIAVAIQGTMTIANFEGHIKQEDGEAFRQFGVSSITGDQDNATMLINFAGQGFKLDISYDPNYTGGK